MSKTTKAITLELEYEGEELELTFNVSDQDYIKHTNEIQLDDKYAPFHNLLVRTVSPEDKEELTDLLGKAPLALTIGGNLLKEFMPEIKVKAKKPSK